MIDRNRTVNNDVLREVFRTQLDGAAEKVISFTDGTGNFNIVRLNSIEAGDVASVDEQIKRSTRRILEQRNGSSLFQSYLDGLSKELESEINTDLL